MSSLSNMQQIARVSDMPLAAGGMVEAGPQPAEGGLTFADFWRVLKQRKLLTAVSFCVLYALIVAATLIVWKWFPAYPATAYLQLRPPVQDPLKYNEQLVNRDIMETLLTTEAQKIDQLEVIQDVLSQKEIQNTRFYHSYPTFDDCLFDLQKNLLRVTPVPNTELIMVSLATSDKEEARLIVDTLVKRYVERYAQETGLRGQRSLQDLKTTRDEVARELGLKQADLRKFRAQSNVGALESEGEALGRAIADQQYSVHAQDARAADLQAQLDSVINIDPRSLPITPEDRVIVEADPLLRLYRQQVEALDIELRVAETYVSGPNSKAIKEMRMRRDGYYEKEVAKREELLDDLRERKVDNLRQELARVRNVQATLQDQLQSMENRRADLDSARVNYDAMVADEQRLQRQLEMIDAAVIERQHIVEAAPNAPRLTIAASPRKAVTPSRPNPKLWLGGGVAVALAGAIGLALLRELTDKAVRTPIDVTRHGHLSVLGCVPQLDDEQADVDTIEIATRRAPHSLMAEAFRQIRANLVFSGPVDSQRVLLVTSPGPGNGKTAVAINLAVTLAQGNQRVLLIDGNFRRPAIREAFAGTRPEGLSNVLIGQARLNDLVTPTDVPNLHVLTSGPLPPTPADLLGSTYMRDMLAEAKSRYDRVIFDGPPILLISDGLVLASQVDGVIVVARAVENSKGVLRRAREQLDKINAHVLGAVLNGVQARAGGYYKQQYRDFYEYSSDETIPRELPGVPGVEPPVASPPDDGPTA